MELEIHAKVAVWDLGSGVTEISLVFCSCGVLLEWPLLQKWWTLPF